MPKNKKLYNYLYQTGVLPNGTHEDIQKAKKKYWAEVRNEWRRQMKKECKSYTVFYTQKEIDSISSFTKGKSITGFIKQSAIQVAQGTNTIDKEIKGQIRLILFAAYNDIEQLMKNGNGEINKKVFARLDQTEKQILVLLLT